MATRLAKAVDFDAIVVAAVAFERLDMGRHLSHVLEVDQVVPQVGQAALGIECRSGDTATIAALSAIEHAPSRRQVDVERAFLAELGGDCSLPAGAHATMTADGSMVLRAVLADAAGGRTVHDAAVVARDATASDAAGVGAALASRMRAELESGP